MAENILKRDRRKRQFAVYGTRAVRRGTAGDTGDGL
jgi:hypothetical protein